MVKQSNQKKKGAVRKIKGKGDYEVSRPNSAPSGGILGKLDKVLSRLPKGTFAAGGGALGARLGGPAGAMVGRKLGAGMSAISGYGDYEVKSNSLGKVSTSADMVPQFVKNEHSVRVVHREYIKDLLVPDTPTAFSNTEYTINPGNAALFPWCARMAKQYSQYKIHGMVFVYKAMTSDYAASGPLGTVVMATNYNTVDRAFITKVEMENSEFAVSCKPSQSLIHAIECDASVSGETVLYIRDPAYETNDTSDKRFYDFGKFQLATAGLPGTSTPGTTLGEIWVSYDIEFMKPILGGDSVVGPCPCIVGRFDGSVGVAPNSNPTGRVPQIMFAQSIAPLAGVGYEVSVDSNLAYTTTGDDLAGEVVDLQTDTIILRKNGRYVINYRIFGDTTGSNFALGSPITGQSGGSIAGTGTAQGAITAAKGRVPYAVLTVAATLGYNTVLTQEVYISGISDGTGSINYATITPPSFTANTVNLIGSITKQTTVSWLSVGQNGQGVAFTPSAYP